MESTPAPSCTPVLTLSPPLFQELEVLSKMRLVPHGSEATAADVEVPALSLAVCSSLSASLEYSVIWENYIWRLIDCNVLLVP
jgi:hypothetical protein